MDTPMLQKLREYLANTPREQIDRDWAAVKAKGLKGPTVQEFIASFKLTPAYQESNSEAFKTEPDQTLLNFDLQLDGANYAMAA